MTFKARPESETASDGLTPSPDSIGLQRGKSEGITV